MADKKISIEALVVLKTQAGKRVEIGETTEVSQASANVLVKNKQAKLVDSSKG